MNPPSPWRQPLLLLPLCLWLASCAAAPLADRQGCDADTLLREVGHTASVSPGRIDENYARARESFERTEHTCDRFRVALLAFASESRKNDAYAARLMEEYLTPSTSGTALGGLARILLRASRQELEADARLRSANRRLSEEQNRADALRRQLEELKNIEKIIKERETP